MKFPVNDVIEIAMVAFALVSYAAGAPNLGHFFMFCITIDKLERLIDGR